MHVIDNNTFSEVGSKCIQMFDPEEGKYARRKVSTRGTNERQ